MLVAISLVWGLKAQSARIEASNDKLRRRSSLCSRSQPADLQSQRRVSFPGSTEAWTDRPGFLWLDDDSSHPSGTVNSTVSSRLLHHSAQLHETSSAGFAVGPLARRLL